MIHVALYEPEIPPNTGNIARLCAAAEIPLHIVGQPAFRMDDRTVRRAGLDYWPYVNISRHDHLADLKQQLGIQDTVPALSSPPGPAAPRLLCLTTKATRSYTDWQYRPGDCLLFGPETRGLPADILAAHSATCLTIPMKSSHVRSLNLANAVSIVLYEALRQLGHFSG
jgi:tRNA (cytidine/uridine-2'-O-)-methyltransferase